MSLNEGLITLMHYFVGVWTVTQLFFTLVILGSRPTTPICNASVLPKASQEKSVGEEARGTKQKIDGRTLFGNASFFSHSLTVTKELFFFDLYFFKVETSVAKKIEAFSGRILWLGVSLLIRPTGSILVKTFLKN